MKRIIAAALAVTTVLGGHAAAQQAHVGGGLAINEGFDDFGAVARGGYDFNEFFGAEAEVSYFSVGEGDIDADLVTYIAFAKGQAEVSPGVSVFGRVGYGGVSVDVDGVGSGSDDLFAYGVGGEYAVTPNGAVRADYTRYDLNGGSEGFLSLSYVFRFGGAQQ